MAPKVYSITMTAGAGSRMPEDMRPKSCCKVGALSTIENVLRTYEQAGITHHVVVIGHAADQVMDEVTRTRRNVLFAYQRQARGTGDAVRCALDLLDALDPPESVLICAGDKVLAPHVIRGVLETYADQGCDLCLTGGPTEHFPYAGRIVERNGMVQGIVEVPDIDTARFAARVRSLSEADRPASVEALRALASEFLPNPRKLAKCLPKIHELLAGPAEESISWPRVVAALATVSGEFELACGRIPLAEAEQASLVNVQPYVARFGPLRDALSRLRTDNVQGEEYFTDVVAIMASEGRAVRVFRIGHPEDVMAFNNLAELEAIRTVHAQRSLDEVRYPTLAQWTNGLRTRADSCLPEAVRQLAARIGGERQAVLVRSPGRINLMGRHVDHQGGICNLMAIDREIVMVASLRDDDRINLWNVDSQAYPDRTFTIGELTQETVWEDWLRTLSTQFIQRAVSMSAGDWGNYVKGAALRLQHRFHDRRLRGMDAFVSGDIPVAAGLSSSSALLVAAAEALIELNAINVRISEFVDLCGEGEWYVGTRGGSADHAAIKHGRESRVISVDFFPSRVLAHHPFPEECSLVVCHSGQFARKTENARERFNARVACYHMVRETLKKNRPEFADRIQHLRDVNGNTLALSLPALYRLLAELPNEVPPAEVEAMARLHPTIEKCLAGVDPSRNAFPLRDMALYGLAECARSAMAGSILDSGDTSRFGRMMRFSHDGDRVAQGLPHQQPFDSSMSEETMRGLAERASSLVSLETSGAALWMQPGAYDCSTPEIDRMIDIASGCPGVIGAQLSGAGLGGCIMILARHEAADGVRDALSAQYYEPRGIEPNVFVCRPSRGSHVLTTLDSA